MASSGFTVPLVVSHGPAGVNPTVTEPLPGVKTMTLNQAISFATSMTSPDPSAKSDQISQKHLLNSSVEA